MSKKPEREWGTTAAVAAGAAIGSAAVAAALLFVRSQRDKTPAYTPPHPEDAPETD
jgi:Na+/H+-translocating membrane pyrophosphatase